MRSLLTIASTAICLSLMMILMSFFAISDEANASTRIFNRIACLNANGFAGMLPISRVAEIAQLDGIIAVVAVLLDRQQVSRRDHAVCPVWDRPQHGLQGHDEFTVPPD